MLRRIFAALLAAAISLPAPVLAGGGCAMSNSGSAAFKSCCCHSDKAAAPKGHCDKPAETEPGCACELRADTGHQPAVGTSVLAPTIRVVSDAIFLPAKLSTPQRETRSYYRLTASPPGARPAISRPQICSWII